MPNDKPPARVPAAEIVALSKQHGMLAKQFYAVVTTPVDGLGPLFAVMEQHLAFQVKLEKDGIMVAAGPNWTDDGEFWEGDGLYVIRAASLAEAKKIAGSDPMHSSGARKFRVRPWMINEGGLTIRLDFSTGKFTLT